MRKKTKTWNFHVSRIDGGAQKVKREWINGAQRGFNTYKSTDNRLNWRILPDQTNKKTLF